VKAEGERSGLRLAGAEFEKSLARGRYDACMSVEMFGRSTGFARVPEQQRGLTTVSTTFDSFFCDQGKPLLAAAYALTGDLGEAQDLVQEVMLRTWRSWNRVSKMDKPEGWARRVLVNLAIGRFRRIRSSMSWSGPVPNVQPPEVGHIDVARAMRRLPHKQMRSILLHDVLGLSVAETAAEMGSPQGSVRGWLSMGRRALAQTLGVSGPASAGGVAPRGEEES